MARLLGMGRRGLVGRASTRSWLSTTSSSTVAAASPSPSTSTYPGWRVLEERRVAEFNIDATLLVHEKTKARLGLALYTLFLHLHLHLQVPSHGR